MILKCIQKFWPGNSRFIFRVKVGYLPFGQIFHIVFHPIRDQKIVLNKIFIKMYILG